MQRRLLAIRLLLLLAAGACVGCASEERRRFDAAAQRLISDTARLGSFMRDRSFGLICIVTDDPSNEDRVTERKGEAAVRDSIAAIEGELELMPPAKDRYRRYLCISVRQYLVDAGGVVYSTSNMRDGYRRIRHLEAHLDTIDVIGALLSHKRATQVRRAEPRDTLGLGYNRVVYSRQDARYQSDVRDLDMDLFKIVAAERRVLGTRVVLDKVFGLADTTEVGMDWRTPVARMISRGDSALLSEVARLH